MSIGGVICTPLSIIDTLGGDVFHAMKSSDIGYSGFGEAYFSTVDFGAVKGWKRHHEMVLNLVVPVGEVRFVLYDDRQASKSYGSIQEITLSKNNNYARLAVPPMIWMGFQGMDLGVSMLLNIANIEHSPSEVDRKELSEIDFNWSK